MMDREWKAILNRYGQQMLVHTGQESVPLRAILQPVLEKTGEDRAPSPLGLREEARFLYLGPADVALKPRESRVEWLGMLYEVERAQPVMARKTHHWQALLRPADRRAT